MINIFTTRTVFPKSIVKKGQVLMFNAAPRRELSCGRSGQHTKR
jgi:hypothetical protein